MKRKPPKTSRRCRVKLALRRYDDGNEYNRVRSFEVIGIDPPDVDPFAPTAGPHPGPLPTGEGTSELTAQAADGSAGGEHDDF